MIIFKISTAVVFILVIIIINPQRTAEFRQESQPLSRGLEAIGIKQKFEILFNWHFSTRRVFSEGQPRQHAKVKGLIEKQISWKLNLQERKSVKIGGVTKAPEESGGGNSLQFLQVHFKLFLRDELQNFLFFLTIPPWCSGGDIGRARARNLQRARAQVGHRFRRQCQTGEGGKGLWL